MKLNSVKFQVMDEKMGNAEEVANEDYLRVADQLREDHTGLVSLVFRGAMWGLEELWWVEVQALKNMGIKMKDICYVPMHYR